MVYDDFCTQKPGTSLVLVLYWKRGDVISTCARKLYSNVLSILRLGELSIFQSLFYIWLSGILIQQPDWIETLNLWKKNRPNWPGNHRWSTTSCVITDQTKSFGTVRNVFDSHISEPFLGLMGDQHYALHIYPYKQAQSTVISVRKVRVNSQVQHQ